MKLEKWALIAEIVAALAIVCSLMFVGVQIRQGEFNNVPGFIAEINAVLSGELDPRQPPM